MADTTSIPQVRIGRLTLPMAEALELYRSIDPVTAPNIAEASCEQIALWNAIQKADREAKGLRNHRPLRYGDRDRRMLDAAAERLERRIGDMAVAA